MHLIGYCPIGWEEHCRPHPPAESQAPHPELSPEGWQVIVAPRKNGLQCVKQASHAVPWFPDG